MSLFHQCLIIYFHLLQVIVISQQVTSQNSVSNVTGNQEHSPVVKSFFNGLWDEFVGRISFELIFLIPTLVAIGIFTGCRCCCPDYKDRMKNRVLKA